MRYFFIFGNITSITGFGAVVYQYIKDENQSELAFWLLAVTLVFSVGFWIYFYLRPSNPISKKIISNLDFSGMYTNSNGQQIDIIEDEITLDTVTWGTIVSLPPFEGIPDITIIRNDKNIIKELPEISDVSNDSFRIKIHSSSLSGKWRWRARGKFLKRIDSANKNNVID